MAERESLDGPDVSAKEMPAKEIQPPAISFANETEREVAQVFAEILDLQWVSPEDDIFSLGGDSFEAVRIALELEYRFSVEFPVELLESAGRVRELAAWINAQPRSADTKQRATLT
jgi:acyl carrier protein